MTGATLIRGHARFEDPHTVRVGDELLEADRIFLNVGGRATIPDIPGLSDVDYLTNVGILDLDELPEHLVIIGGSYIALEFAQMYRRFGSRVSVVERGPRLTAREDEDVSAAIKEILEAEGIDVHLGATADASHQARQRVRRSTCIPPTAQNRCRVRTYWSPRAGGPTPTISARPRRGRHRRRGYVQVDDQLRTRSTTSGRWATATARAPSPTRPTTTSNRRRQPARRRPASVSDRITTYAMYIDPPLGPGGHDRRRGAQSGRRALVGKRPMTKVGRAVEKGETQGFMKVVVDADTEQILGAAILGVGGDEVVQDILDVMTAKLPYTAISRTMHIHPTVGELVPTMLGRIFDRWIDRPNPKRLAAAARAASAPTSR